MKVNVSLFESLFFNLLNKGIIFVTKKRKIVLYKGKSSHEKKEKTQLRKKIRVEVDPSIVR